MNHIISYALRNYYHGVARSENAYSALRARGEERRAEAAVDGVDPAGENRHEERSDLLVHASKVLNRRRPTEEQHRRHLQGQPS